MTELRKAAEMALKFCEDIGDFRGPYPYVDQTSIVSDSRKILQALRQALAQPVDAVNISKERVDETVKREHEWVGLTDEEKYDVLEGATGDGGRVYYDTLFRSYEAKLKEKNGGQRTVR